MKQIGIKNKGCSGEHYAMGEAVSKGYVVSKTTETDLLGYDFVMDDGDILYRVEVKTQDYGGKSRTDGKKFTDRIKFNLTRRNSIIGIYDYIHYFALVCPKFNKIAWIKYDLIKNTTKKTIYYREFDILQLPVNHKLLNGTLNNISNDIQDNQINLF